MDDRRGRDEPVRRIAMLEVIGLREYCDARRYRQNLEFKGVYQVFDELEGIALDGDTPFGDEHGNFPEADIARRHCTMLARQSHARRRGEPVRLQAGLDQSVRVKNDQSDDHAQRPRLRPKGS